MRLAIMVHTLAVHSRWLSISGNGGEIRGNSGQTYTIWFRGSIPRIKLITIGQHVAIPKPLVPNCDDTRKATSCKSRINALASSNSARRLCSAKCRNCVASWVVV